MTFEEQAAELAKLEALAESFCISGEAFERIALEVMYEARESSVMRLPAQALAEIRRRIEPPGTRKPGAP